MNIIPYLITEESDVMSRICNTDKYSLLLIIILFFLIAQNIIRK